MTGLLCHVFMLGKLGPKLRENVCTVIHFKRKMFGSPIEVGLMKTCGFAGNGVAEESRAYRWDKNGDRDQT